MSEKHSMTIDEAIQAIKNELLCVSRQTDEGCDRECGKCDLALADDVILSAYDMALTALRAQQEAEKNKPLTLDELRQMDGEPVYIVPQSWYGKKEYAIVDKNLCSCVSVTLRYIFEEYRTLWLAYRRPPKEAHDGADT